ncbi:MAG: septum formation initiator family protein [Clostridia bacterium]|nr:septum formation initiator family protein [Clostridia bacterium]
MKNRGNIFVRLLWVGFVVLALFSIVSSQMTINELNAQKEELAEEVIAVQDEVDEMRFDLERPIDDEYIIRFAREKLGLHFPGETIFHYDVKN